MLALDSRLLAGPADYPAHHGLGDAERGSRRRQLRCPLFLRRSNDETGLLTRAFA
ncbi:MAG: hypothetical protein R3F37_08975 [Candidatus Competibacteraceae bacterium]